MNHIIMIMFRTTSKWPQSYDYVEACNCSFTKIISNIHWKV